MMDNMSTSDLRVSVGTTVKFNGRNYALWSQAFRTFLGSQGHDHHLVDKMSDPKDSKYAAWRQSDCIVNTWMLNSLEPEIAASVGLTSTAKEMWDAIKEMFSNDVWILSILTWLHMAMCVTLERAKVVIDYVSFVVNEGTPWIDVRISMMLFRSVQRSMIGCFTLNQVLLPPMPSNQDLQTNTVIRHGSESGGVYYLSHDSSSVAVAAGVSDKLSVPLPTPMYTSIPPSKPLQSIKISMYQLDIKNAFLYGDLIEEVYMEQLPGFVAQGEPHLVCKLKQAIYGLKQSPRAWFDKFNHVVFATGFRRSQADHSVFVRHSSSGIVGLVLSQRKYVTDLLQETGLLGAKPADVPMEPNLDMWKEDDDFEDSAQYRRLVGKLIYLTVTRPDIVHVMRLISQFMEKPKKCHQEADCNILRYIKKSPGKGLCYCTFVGGNLVTWKSKMQTVVSRFSAEDKYRAMAHTTCELIWLKALLEDFSITYTDPFPMHCDNQATIHIASNPVFHEWTKHIEVDCYFVRNVVTSKKICTPFTPSKDQVADMFTKALRRMTSLD
ncbi:Retrovirus-related Pol polyprotein from transposon RE1 [Vitis vinifera]|uniref:Retrovirus-related Pol polyprotein from transposon RE1 n=1 Tax=Vitis vinifera TaxID=29760 RepID=A0A438CCE8_VITVI|nr:Retrovirus-related Pol polyprotein from transposon RE1 [Vitis vinifera]